MPCAFVAFSWLLRTTLYLSSVFFSVWVLTLLGIYCTFRSGRPALEQDVAPDGTFEECFQQTKTSYHKLSFHISYSSRLICKPLPSNFYKKGVKTSSVLPVFPFVQFRYCKSCCSPVVLTRALWSVKKSQE